MWGGVGTEEAKIAFVGCPTWIVEGRQYVQEDGLTWYTARNRGKIDGIMRCANKGVTVLQCMMGPGRRAEHQSPKRGEGMDPCNPYHFRLGSPRLNVLTFSRSAIVIALAGKFAVGKSHTTNSLLNEEAAKKQFLNREGAPPTAHTREAHGFTLSVIDTGGITETDIVSPSVSS